MSNKNNEQSNYSENHNEESNSIIKKSSTLDAQSLYKILIKNPNLVNSTDDQKESILSLAIKKHNISVSNLILTSPILNLNYQDKDGNSYLHLAILYKQEEIIKSLIEKGIFLNKKNNKGNTALHLAYMNYDKHIINILEENGIDTNIVNNNNKLAEDLKINLKQNSKKYNTNVKMINKDNNKSIDRPKDKTDKNQKMNNNLNLSNNKNIRIITQYQTKRINNENNNKNNCANNKVNNLTNSLNINSKNKIIPSEVLINKNKKSVSTNQDQFDHYEEFLNTDKYETNIQNDKNKKYYEKAININHELTKKNININNNINENKFTNYAQKEKNTNNHRYFEEIAILDEKQNFNTFSDLTKRCENTKKKLEVNKIINSNINTNRTSPKISKKERVKKFIPKKIRNSNKNTCLSKLIGNTNNVCLSKDYAIKSEQKNLNSQKENLLVSNKELSASTKNMNCYDECKINKFIQKNENKSNIGLTNRAYNQKNLKINDQLKNENYIEKKSSNNIIRKPLNLGSSLMNQNQPKVNIHKENKLLKEFLSQINLIKYFNNMDSNGFDDVNILIEEAKKGALIKDQELKEIGIPLPGDRAKILIRIKEKANIFGFSVPKGVYHVCENLDKMLDDKYILELDRWLTNLKVENYLINFVKSGYHSLELLLIQMETESPINQEILRDEIGIDIIGYRSRILNKLREDGKNMNNKLKTTTLIVNQNGNEKNCECFIF